MRIRSFLFGLLALTLTIGLVGCDSGGSNGGGNGGNGDNGMNGDVTVTIDSLVEANSSFSTLETALNAADVTALDDTDQNFTVFAPTDDAFEALNVDALTDSDSLTGVLEYHVIPGDSLGSGDLNDEDSFTTLSGAELEVEVDGNGNVFVEGSPVTDADITADNGVVHAIGERPLLGNQPPTNVLEFSGNFTTLNDALSEAELAGTLDDDGSTFTIFAPTDDALGALNTNALLNSDALGSVLQYHVIEGDSLGAAELSDGQTLTTLAGQDLTVEKDGSGNVSVEGSPVTEADIAANNGVIHGIGDKPLLGNQPLTNVLRFVAETQSLVQAIAARGLTGGIGGPEVGTVFAPNNSAVTGNSEMINNFSNQEVQQVLRYHTLADEFDSGALLSLLNDNDGQVKVATRLEGDSLVIAQDENGNVLFNPDGQGNAQATLDTDNVDFEGVNNITHVIDGLLLPPSFREKAVTIDSLVEANSSFSTLETALNSAGVTALDNEDQNFTVFAPTDDAFGSLNTDALLDSDALGSVLQYHVIEGDSLGAAELSDGQTLTTLAGQDLTVEVDGSGNVSVEGSPVTDADITADNGVIHGIGDKPLLGNQPLTSVLQFVSETQRLVEVIAARGLTDGIGGSDVGTVFAPNNAAIDNNSETIDGLSDEEVQQVLQYHTLADENDSGALSTLLSDNDGQVTVQTRLGEDLVIAQDGNGNVLFNPDGQGNAQATLDTDNVDFEGANNITHVIDGLLIPPSFAQ